MYHIIASVFFLCLSVSLARSDPKPLILTMDRLTPTEHEALSAVLTRVLTDVLGVHSTKLVTAKVRYHYGNDEDHTAIICEGRDIDLPLPSAIYEHQWYGVEELFRKDLEQRAAAAVFVGRALPSDTLVFVQVAGPPEITFHQVVGGTLITIAPLQVLVYREYMEA